MKPGGIITWGLAVLLAGSAGGIVACSDDTGTGGSGNTSSSTTTGGGNGGAGGEGGGGGSAPSCLGCEEHSRTANASPDLICPGPARITYDDVYRCVCGGTWDGAGGGGAGGAPPGEGFCIQPCALFCQTGAVHPEEVAPPGECGGCLFFFCNVEINACSLN